jgi:Immunity protein 52
MTGEVNHVEAYWRPRPESTRDCAVRLARMLEGLVKAHSAFSHWNKQAYSQAAANKPAWHMPPHIDELTTVFEKGRQYKDRPRVLWPEMGYSVSAWNGIERPHGATLRIRSGGFTSSRFFPNTVDLKVNRAGPDNTDLISSAVLKPALLSVATAWGPDYAVVVPWTYWPRVFGDGGYPTLRSGWMTYLAPKYATRIIPPPSAIVEPVSNGGLLLLATEDQFDMENPAHLAAVAAVQTALGPLQEMIPPTP